MSTESRELALYAENNAQLYYSRIEPVIKNLALKQVRGVYDPQKALVLWKYVADDAAQRYTKEFDTGGTSSYGIFTVADRKEAAAELAESYAEQVNDYFKDHPEQIPKKYRQKNPSRRSIHTAKFDRCVKEVKAKGGSYNPYAVCMSTIGERGSIKAGHRRKKNPVSGFVLVARSGSKRAYYDGEDFDTNKHRAKIYESIERAQLAGRMMLRSKSLRRGWRLAAAPATRQNPANEAERLYTEFHGEPPQHVKHRKLPAFREGVEVGPLVAVTYDTIRDGKITRYEHEFKHSASPLLVVSDDGRKAGIIGGDFRFTDRGFIDHH